MTGITAAQRRKIWAAANQRGLDEDDLREIVRQITGQTSTKALTIHEAVRVIDRLEGKPEKPAGNQITKKQLWKIKDLEKALGWDDNSKRLEAFVRKYAHVDKLPWLTRYQAINVIDGLKAVLARAAAGK
jgi:phage gp16-like protein